jgi:hypothetical protein
MERMQKGIDGKSVPFFMLKFQFVHRVAVKISGSILRIPRPPVYFCSTNHNIKL